MTTYKFNSCDEGRDGVRDIRMNAERGRGERDRLYKYLLNFLSLNALSLKDAKSEYWARLKVSSRTGSETEADVLPY